MEYQYILPAVNVIGSVVFFAFLKPRIEKWQQGKSRMEEARKQFIAETKRLVDSANSTAKRQQLGQLISLTAEVERETVKRFYRLVVAFGFIAALTVWLDLTAYIFFQAEKFQWVFHLNSIVNWAIFFYIFLRAHSLDEELSDFEQKVVLSYCAKTHVELAKQV